MKFLADENCDKLIVMELRQTGYDVEYIAELLPGIDDIDILRQSLTDQRVLITEDLDFCEMVFRDAAPAFAIILIRIASDQRIAKASRIREFIKNAAELAGTFTTITLDTIRTRPLPM
ncbi:MAG: DUF5615 family PIN-like protein [Anaerolineae bacterium]